MGNDRMEWTHQGHTLLKQTRQWHLFTSSHIPSFQVWHLPTSSRHRTSSHIWHLPTFTSDICLHLLTSDTFWYLTPYHIFSFTSSHIYAFFLRFRVRRGVAMVDHHESEPSPEVVCVVCRGGGIQVKLPLRVASAESWKQVKRCLCKERFFTMEPVQVGGVKRRLWLWSPMVAYGRLWSPMVAKGSANEGSRWWWCRAIGKCNCKWLRMAKRFITVGSKGGTGLQLVVLSVFMRNASADC